MFRSFSQEIDDGRAAEGRLRAEPLADTRRHGLDKAPRGEAPRRRPLVRQSSSSHGTALHPALPRVMCPQCGAHMRLERIVPCAAHGRRAETVSFACTCRFTLQQTIERLG